MIEFYDRLHRPPSATTERITKVLDVSCGIGTQAIALAQAGFSKAVQTHAMRSRYYAISPCKVLTLMEEAGFAAVKRLDDVFYQPVLIGTKLP